MTRRPSDRLAGKKAEAQVAGSSVAFAADTGPARPLSARRAALDAYLEADPDLVDRCLFAATLERSRATVTTPAQAMAHLLPYFFGQENERFVAVGLDRQNRVVDTAVLTVGCAAYTIVDPCQILRWALTRSSLVAALLVAHNHPSGSTEPSKEDQDVTIRLTRAARVVGIPILDHFVVGSQGAWTSMSERGQVPEGPKACNWLV